MKTEIQSPMLDTERIEQFSTIALVVGVLAVYQSGFTWLYWIGLALLALGAIGTLASQVMQQNRIMRIIERMAVVGMMTGILGMLQPWHIWLYENGFYVLGISTLAFIIALHIETPTTE